jgi:hypothetical protein
MNNSFLLKFCQKKILAFVITQQKVLLKIENKFSRGFRGKTRIFIDIFSFIGVHLRLSAAKNCFPGFLLSHYEAMQKTLAFS